jgi:TolB-like protein/Tfp pilus assembly protein PilF
MDLLTMLASRPEQAVPLKEICLAVWGHEHVSLEDIDATLSELRWALEDDPDRPGFLEAEPDAGFRLLVGAEPAGGAEAIGQDGGTLRRIVRDLRRRHVFRVAAAYSIAAWVVIQVADVLFDALGAPALSMRLLVVTLGAGLPIAIALAWAYQLTPQGLRIDPVTGQRRGRAGLPPVVFATAGVGAALVGGMAYWWTYRPVLDADGPPPAVAFDSSASVAVLPFADLDGADSAAYLGDGLSEEIQQRLATIAGLSVASRRSSFQFRDQEVPSAQIAQRLGVAYVLEGSVRSQADRLRVFVELVDGQTGFAVWSETFDRGRDAIFDIQSDIARAIAAEIGVPLGSASEARLAEIPTQDLGAYDLYLRALAQFRSARGQAALRVAAESFRKAAAADPDFAQAYAGLCKVRLEQFDLTRAPERFEAAERACFQALSRDADAVEVYLALGELFRRSGDVARALERFDDVLKRDPDIAEAHLGRAKALMGQGDTDGAEAALTRALNLEPGLVAAIGTLGRLYFLQARYADAAEQYTRLLTVLPDDAGSLGNLGAAHYMQGEFEEAAEAWRRSVELEPSGTTYLNLGTMYFYLGRYAESVEMYQRALTYTPEHFLAWGFIGDAWSQIEGGEGEARAAYAQAIALGDALLAVNPSDVEALGSLAAYHARIGNKARADELLARAMRLAPADYYNHYYAAILKLAVGDSAGAMDSIREAARLGMPGHILAGDPMLTPLRDQQGFLALADE